VPLGRGQDTRRALGLLGAELISLALVPWHDHTLIWHVEPREVLDDPGDADEMRGK